MPTPADSVPFDRRQRFYKLTTEGCSHVDNFLEQIAPIEETLNWITSQKTDEAFSKYALHLRRGLDFKAFDSREKLKKAVLDRRLPTKRKLSLPLSSLLATKKK